MTAPTKVELPRATPRRIVLRDWSVAQVLKETDVSLWEPAAVVVPEEEQEAGLPGSVHRILIVVRVKNVAWIPSDLPPQNVSRPEAAMPAVVWGPKNAPMIRTAREVRSAAH